MSYAYQKLGYGFILVSIILAHNRVDAENKMELTHYLSKLSRQNNISYQNISNTSGSYIPAMCYSKTRLLTTSSQMTRQQNPCYVCHIQGVPPNYINDSHLQKELSFPKEMLTNPYKNLFSDRSKQVDAISDKEIISYIRQSNYLLNGEPILAKELPENWPGYRPDAYFQFDEQGFDHDPYGHLTLWRAFRYYPFPGTFWPTNGSTDDVLIRLDKIFRKNKAGKVDLEIYKLNLAIVESLIKFQDVFLSKLIDERKIGADLDRDGNFTVTKLIKFPPQHYLGQAREYQTLNKIHLAPGLFPEGTEFLHSVRYLDWDSRTNRIILSPRMKELRYARKYRWLNYAELKVNEEREFLEQQQNLDQRSTLEIFRGSPEQGLKTNNGWVYQGFIEAKNGRLRPQTREETIYCMGCHSGIGATTDANFSFPRKYSEKEIGSSWLHWSQKGLFGVKEPTVSYKEHKDILEYSFYLQNNHSGNEFIDNDEVKNKFFTVDGNANSSQFNKLHKDISILLYPTLQRAILFNKGYKVIVDQQNYIYGREGNIEPLKNVFKEIQSVQKSAISSAIIR